MTRAMSMLRVLALILFALVGCADPPPPKTLAPSPVRPPVVAPLVPPSTSEIVPVHADDPVLGPRRARVTIVVWSDFQCPFCAKLAPTLAQLRERYPTQLRVVWKDAPLAIHPHAREAAIAARAAFLVKGLDAFLKLHDAFFAHQAYLSREAILDFSAEVGVAESDVAAHRPAAESKIEESLDEAKRLGLAATPAMMIDGQRVIGAKPLQEIAAIVDAHLAEADELAAKGVPDDRIYDELVKVHYVAPQEPQLPPIEQTVWKVDLGDAPTQGSADAKVTVVVFADFQCPYCKKNAATLAKLAAKYPGKLRFAFKHDPLDFHARAVPAAILALEARAQGGDALFFKAHDALFAAQSSLEDEDLLRIATELGLDLGKVKIALDKQGHREAIDKDVDQAEMLRVRGTPITFVNGRRIEGALPLSVFARVVDEEMIKADAKIAGGTPASKLYESIVANGRGPVKLSVPKGAPFKGNKDAKVVVHVFGDHECPACRRFELEAENDPGAGALERVFKEYGSVIRVVWRDFPLSSHPNARRAAAFAREALAQKGMAAFWKVHEALFRAQDHLDDATFASIAKTHGLDAKKLEKALETGTWDAPIDEDLQAGNDAFLGGTPSVFVNDRYVSGHSDAALSKAIERALARAGVKLKTKPKGKE